MEYQTTDESDNQQVLDFQTQQFIIQMMQHAAEISFQYKQAVQALSLLRLKFEALNLQLISIRNIQEDNQELYHAALDQQFELQNQIKKLTLQGQSMRKQIQKLLHQKHIQSVQKLAYQIRQSQSQEKQMYARKKVYQLEKIIQKINETQSQNQNLYQNQKEQILRYRDENKKNEIEKNQILKDLQKAHDIINIMKKSDNNQQLLAKMRKQIMTLKQINIKNQLYIEKIMNQKNQQILSLKQDVQFYKRQINNNFTNQSPDKDLNKSCYKNTAQSNSPDIKLSLPYSVKGFQQKEDEQIGQQTQNFQS